MSDFGISGKIVELPCIFFKNGLAIAKFFCYTPSHTTQRVPFPGSSVVEQLTVNQLVAGSNPARGATFSYFNHI